MTFGTFTSRPVANVLGALALLGSLAAAAPASAGPTIIGSNYMETGIRFCGGSVSCVMYDFTLIPAGKLLLVNRMSCAVEVTKGSVLLHSTFGRHVGLAPNVSFPMYSTSQIKVSESATHANYQINWEPSLVITPNTRPAVVIGVRAPTVTFQVACTVVGTLMNM